jgi:Trk K+ transport system NAD-binding subunit
MKRTRFIIIGVGKIGADLLQKLSKDYELLCIDNAPGMNERVRKLRGEGGTTVMQADATSRLALEEAGINDAECVIVTTTSEPVNIEVCRLLKEHFRPKRVIAIGTSIDGIKQLTDLGAEVQDLFAVGAAGIRNLLEQRTRTATTIGLGKSEIIEVELHPHSRLANKPLRNLAPLRWKIGIIYREGNIIIPRGDTVLRPKDHLVLLGDPSVLKTVAEIMTFSFVKFPLEYGSTVVAYLTGGEDEQFFAELEYLFTIFPLQRIIFVHPTWAAGHSLRYEQLVNRERYPAVENRTIDLPPLKALAKAAGDDKSDCGLAVLAGGLLRNSILPRYRKRAFRELCRMASCPVLLSRGTFPYERVAVPAADGLEPYHALETALEVASSLNNAVSALLVQPIRHIASDASIQKFEAARKAVSDLSIMYRADVATRNIEGNPVRAVLRNLGDQNVLYLDSNCMTRQTWPFSLLNPDPAWHLIRRSPITTMIVPPVEESL